MTKFIKGTRGNDHIEQGRFAALRVETFNGDDFVLLNLTNQFGGGNKVYAGKGNDKVDSLFEGGNIIKLAGGDDGYVGFGFSQDGRGDTVNGGAGNDQFVVRTLLSTYLGGKGDDLFNSSGHNNTFNGGTGNDTIAYQFRQDDFNAEASGINISLIEGKAITGEGKSEELISIENAIGSPLSDLITGDNGANVIDGGAGSDELRGLAGDDVLIGGANLDALIGGAGADRFLFRSMGEFSARGDFIIDFDAAQGDKVDLSEIQNFRFIGNQEFTGTGFEVRFDDRTIEVDFNGDGSLDGIININVEQMSESDFIL